MENYEIYDVLLKELKISISTYQGIYNHKLRLYKTTGNKRVREALSKDLGETSAVLKSLNELLVNIQLKLGISDIVDGGVGTKEYWNGLKEDNHERD